MVRRPAIIRRATARIDSPEINRSNTACWLFHQYWRLGDKQAGNREQVPCVCAARDPRLCAAVVFQSENQVVVNSGYRAADIFACVDACSRVNR